MLFGRRKPGFVTEEENPELVSEYNEDRMIAKQQAEAEEKPDLMEYLESLPEVEDPYAEAMAAAAAMPQPEKKEKTKAELLADFIRERSAGAMLTAYAALAAEEEALEALLQEMRETESCADIVSIKGDKDVYYYSNANMSDNYARIAMLVEEKNLPKTIAEMVRFSCKTYPSPTPLDYLRCIRISIRCRRSNVRLSSLKSMRNMRIWQRLLPEITLLTCIPKTYCLKNMPRHLRKVLNMVNMAIAASFKI